MTEEKNHPPQRTSGDTAHAIAKAGLSAIPVFGGPAVELFQFVVQPPLEKRREEWMSEIGKRLLALESKGLDIEVLRQRPEFISALMQASQAALRTHKKEKLVALQNAVINIARGQAPEETTQHLLLSFVDELTEMHLSILKVLHSPEAPPGLSIGGLDSVLEHKIPALRGHKELYEQLWRDLYSRGLINTPNMNVTMSSNGLAQRRTTGFGEALLKFISEEER